MNEELIQKARPTPLNQGPSLSGIASTNMITDCCKPAPGTMSMALYVLQDECNKQHTVDFCSQCQDHCCDITRVKLERNRLMHSGGPTSSDRLHLTPGYIQWLMSTLSLQDTKTGLISMLRKGQEKSPRKISKAEVGGRQTQFRTYTPDISMRCNQYDEAKSSLDANEIFDDDNLAKSKQVVVILVGAAGIGKSTLANNILAGNVQHQETSLSKSKAIKHVTELNESFVGLCFEEPNEKHVVDSKVRVMIINQCYRKEGIIILKDTCTETIDIPKLNGTHTNLPKGNVDFSKDLTKSLFETDNLKRNAAHIAAVEGDIKTLRFLLEDVGLPADAKSSNKLTMLHLAAIYQQLPVVEYLCKEHVSLVNEIDAIGRNACHIAAQKGNLAIVKVLVAYGTDVYAIAGDGSTLLHIASSHESSDMVSFLCENLFFNHLNISNNLGMKPIHFAARCSLPNVKILLDKGEEPHMQSMTGSTIAHVAALRGMLDILKFVCENYRYVLMITDCVGFNAAHHASRHGHLECLKCLLGKKSLLASMVNCHGWTIAHSAAREGQLKVLAYLCENYPQVVAQVDADNWNVAHHAAQYGHVNCLEYLFQNKIVDPCAADKGGMTFLDIAVRHGRDNIVQWLRSSSVTAMVLHE